MLSPSQPSPPRPTPRNERGRFTPTPPLDIQDDSQIPELEAAIKKGPCTMILVHADWCGHCQNYKPMWSELENTPGRIANIARVKETVFPNIPSISKAKIQGYPSVVVLTPKGDIEQYPVEGSSEMTHAVPFMRDMGQMQAVLRQSTPSHKAHRKPKPKTLLNRVVNTVRKTVTPPLRYVSNTLFGTKSYKSPKKTRGGTRRNRRGRTRRA